MTILLHAPASTVGRRLRRATALYLKLASGSLGRVAVQALYFALLVNTLTLPDYGTFAACVSAAIILSCGGSFGFVAPLFRVATTQRRRLGFYLTTLHVYVLATIPLATALGLIVYVAFFDRYIALGPFLAVVFSEVLCIRYVDAIVQLFTALGRFATASTLVLAVPAARTAAVGVLWLSGAHDLNSWAWVYLAGNVSVMVLAAALAPRGRLLWRNSVLKRRLWQSIAFEAVRLIQALGTEFDKILVIVLADQKAAGVYALSMKVIDLANVPVRAAFPLIVRRLIQRPADLSNLSLRVVCEVSICIGSFMLFVGALLVLSLRPTLLGQNVVAAYPWFSACWVLPMARIGLVYHAELFFAADRMQVFTFVAILLLLAQMIGLSVVITSLPDFTAWPAALDIIWSVLYGLSLCAALRLLNPVR
ncbi:hypothetical protein [Methylobacterium sp. AMS5]|uniref:hypothetical protein n=1 Tax=Methylobacterium sp. AMS5 TaxID=925818 RepID=UPI00074FA1C9|nr:hypothetical protein [Methylobacterium sp. AMS5]AMB44408.1 hypothetical protein Y590_05825 [Methylobacterium sp. AMS5]